VIGHAAAGFEGLGGEARPEDDAFVIRVSRGHAQREGVRGKGDFFCAPGSLAEQGDGGEGGGVGKEKAAGEVSFVLKGGGKVVEHKLKIFVMLDV